MSRAAFWPRSSASKAKTSFLTWVLLDQGGVVRGPAGGTVGGNDVLFSGGHPDGERIEDRFGHDEFIGVDLRGVGVPDRAVASGQVEVGHFAFSGDVAAVEAARPLGGVEDRDDDAVVVFFVAALVDEAEGFGGVALRFAQDRFERAVREADLEVLQGCHVAQAAVLEVFEAALVFAAHREEGFVVVLDDRGEEFGVFRGWLGRRWSEVGGARHAGHGVEEF